MTSRYDFTRKQNQESILGLAFVVTLIAFIVLALAGKPRAMPPDCVVLQQQGQITIMQQGKAGWSQRGELVCLVNMTKEV